VQEGHMGYWDAGEQGGSRLAAAPGMNGAREKLL
jgi:hypothetical protein